MSWIDTVTFYSKDEPLSDREIADMNGFLAEPLNEEEIKSLDELCAVTGQIDPRNWQLSDYHLPSEYIDLLRYSRSGLLANGEREFGFFSPEAIRDYYLRYMFPEYQPGAVPIGLNGGGVFYAYDLRNPTSGAPIIATSSNILSWEESVVLGHSLADVFAKDTNIEDEL